MDDLRCRVMPYVKAEVAGDTGPSADLGPENSPVIRDLRNGLVIVYVVDDGQALTYVQNRHLSAAGLDPESLHAAAMSNFLGFIAERTRMQAHGNIFALFLDGNFEASLLLVDSLWDESLAGYAPNGFVVAVPARDILAFTDVASASGVEELRGVVAKVIPRGDHTIASDLYRRQAGRWLRCPTENNAATDPAPG